MSAGFTRVEIAGQLEGIAHAATSLELRERVEVKKQQELRSGSSTKLTFVLDADIASRKDSRGVYGPRRVTGTYSIDACDIALPSQRGKNAFPAVSLNDKCNDRIRWSDKTRYDIGSYLE